MGLFCFYQLVGVFSLPSHNIGALREAFVGYLICFGGLSEMVFYVFVGIRRGDIFFFLFFKFCALYVVLNHTGGLVISISLVLQRELSQNSVGVSGGIL